MLNFENVMNVFWKNGKKMKCSLLSQENFGHKFQFNWISRTQVMDEIVGTAWFSTDSVYARILCTKLAQMKIQNK